MDHFVDVSSPSVVVGVVVAKSRYVAVVGARRWKVLAVEVARCRKNGRRVVVVVGRVKANVSVIVIGRRRRRRRG